MPTEIVVNGSYGGFGLSKKAVIRMAELGNPEAIEEVNINSDFFNSEDYSFYPKSTPRHDPLLVQTVKELEEEASGDSADLGIETIQGNKYIIHEYDGSESVQEPRHIKWIVAD
jgi:hypothetical protein